MKKKPDEKNGLLSELTSVAHCRNDCEHFYSARWAAATKSRVRLKRANKLYNRTLQASKISFEMLYMRW